MDSAPSSGPEYIDILKAHCSGCGRKFRVIDTFTFDEFGVRHPGCFPDDHPGWERLEDALESDEL